MDTSTVVTGLTNSGKTMTAVVPAVLDFPGRQVMSGTKTDIARFTWHQSAEHGGALVFDTMRWTGELFPSMRWTPIAGCEDANVAESRKKAFLPPPDDRDRNAEFKTNGANVLRALLHAAALADRTMEELLAWSYRPDNTDPESVIRRHPRGENLYADELAQVRNQPDKQREGAYMSVRAALGSLAVPQVLTLINHRPSTSFHTPHWLAHGSESLYLLSHNTQNPAAAKVVQLLMTDIFDCGRNLAAASPAGRLDPPLPVIADEATNAAKLGDWPTMLSDSRGWGIPVMMLVQSRQMLRGAYGREVGDAIWSAAGTRLLIGGGDGGGDTREVADAFGEVDITTYSRDIAGAGGSMSTRRQRNRTLADIRNLPPGRGIMLASQMPPIEVALRPWWERDDADTTRWAAETFDRARADGRTLIRARR